MSQPSCFTEKPQQIGSSYSQTAALSSVAVLRGQDQSFSVVTKQFMRLHSPHNLSAFNKRDFAPCPALFAQLHVEIVKVTQ